MEDSTVELSSPSSTVAVAIVSQGDESPPTVSVAHNGKWLEISPILKEKGFSLDKNVVFGVSGIFENISLKAVQDSKSAPCFTCFLWVDETVPLISATGKEVPLGVCILCASEKGVAKTIRYHGTNSFNEHLKNHHQKSWDEISALVATESEKKKRALTPTTGASKRGRSSGLSSGIIDKSEFFLAPNQRSKGASKELTIPEVHRELAALTVTTTITPHAIGSKDFSKFLTRLTIGNSTLCGYKPPSAPTIKNIQLSFQDEAVSNFKKLLIYHEIIDPNGNCFQISAENPHLLPFGSIGVDISATLIEGKASVSLNHFFRGIDFKMIKTSLGVWAFDTLLKKDSSEAEVKTAQRDSAKRLAIWIHGKLEDFGLIPKHLYANDDIATLSLSNYLFGCSTDNGSVEVCVVKVFLLLLHGPCIQHSTDLVTKNGVLDSKSLFKNLLDHVKALVKKAKKSKKVHLILDRQRRLGVLCPTSLITGNATRFSNTSNVLTRYAELQLVST